MKAIFIYFMLGIMVITSVFTCGPNLNTMQTKQEIVLQSQDAALSPEVLQMSKDVLTERLKTFGVSPVEIIPAPEKGQLKVGLVESIDKSVLSDLFTMVGQLEFYGTYNRDEFFNFIGEAEENAELLEILQLSAEEAVSTGSAIIGFAASQDIPSVTDYLNGATFATKFPQDMKFSWSKNQLNNGLHELYALRMSQDQMPLLNGSAIKSAENAYDKNTGTYSVLIDFDEKGTALWAKQTKNNIGKSIAVTMDGDVYMAPRVMDEIKFGKAMITGNFSADEIKTLAAIIQGGALPVPFEMLGEE